MLDLENLPFDNVYQLYRIKLQNKQKNLKLTIFVIFYTLKCIKIEYHICYRSSFHLSEQTEEIKK